ncbi:MAG: thiamine pyrophosphate-binding protein [Leptospira sp.]|nr:thiamine pyrophosphate-binding protein [Leptospira sp.]
MKLSDYIIDFLAKKNVTHFFGMSGGAAVHLFDSVSKHKDTHYVCSQHEQSAAISADGYARVTGKLGVAITTSGPGATNLLTGVCCSYYDSIPTLMLTGQVSRQRLKKDLKVRQLGFQETDIVDIFRSVTKYSAQVLDPGSIRYHLEKAYYYAFEGRPGSVLLDIPDDLQRVEINPDELQGFSPDKIEYDFSKINVQIKELLELIKLSKRPIIVLGGGLNTPRIDSKKLENIINILKIPVLCSWAGVDTIEGENPYNIGTFGVYGPRFGNFAIQNSDLIISLGCRLSQNLTGGILSSFATEARIIMVDADKAELDKFDNRGIDIHHRIQSSLDLFINSLLPELKDYAENFQEWLTKVKFWKEKFPLTRQTIKTNNHVDAYEFVAKLSKYASPGEKIFVDTGGNLTWTLNQWKVKKDQRIISAWNNTPMGYSLPASIGAAFANSQDSITCIIGDGGLMICLSELATLLKHKLNIKVFLFNNHSHGIQKQTLQTWLNGNYVGVDPDSGLAFPDFKKVATAFDLQLFDIYNEDDLDQNLQEIYKIKGPVFCNVEINPDQKLYPVVKFGAALENQLPQLDEEIIKSEMIVKPFNL